MHLQEILGQKGVVVHSISPDETLADVVDQLVERNCGSLVVKEGDRMVGIITERDILRACAAKKGPLETLKVADHMTSKVVTGKADATVSWTMNLLTEKRIRHLPLLDDAGNLAGMISIGDVVKAQSAQLAVENHMLKNYIQS
ncbi:MAG: CBS domain-containing protein [bacterium]|nr:CBS domain-containing protein [bacterium]